MGSGLRFRIGIWGLGCRVQESEFSGNVWGLGLQVRGVG